MVKEQKLRDYNADWGNPASVGSLARSVREFGQSLTCSICHSFYKEPHTTKCFHAFCKVCLLRSLAIKPSCPLCKAECKRREIRSDAKLERLLTLFRQLVPPKEKPVQDPALEFPPSQDMDEAQLRTTQVESLSQLVEGFGGNADDAFPQNRSVLRYHEMTPQELQKYRNAGIKELTGLLASDDEDERSVAAENDDEKVSAYEPVQSKEEESPKRTSENNKDKIEDEDKSESEDENTKEGQPKDEIDNPSPSRQSEGGGTVTSAPQTPRSLRSDTATLLVSSGSTIRNIRDTPSTLRPVTASDVTTTPQTLRSSLKQPLSMLKAKSTSKLKWADHEEFTDVAPCKLFPEEGEGVGVGLAKSESSPDPTGLSARRPGVCLSRRKSQQEPVLASTPPKKATQPESDDRPGDPLFCVGEQVTVARRMHANSKKPGGAAIICQVNGDGTYNVKYPVVGGQETNVHWEHIERGFVLESSSLFGSMDTPLGKERPPPEIRRTGRPARSAPRYLFDPTLYESATTTPSTKATRISSSDATDQAGSAEALLSQRPRKRARKNKSDPSFSGESSLTDSEDERDNWPEDRPPPTVVLTGSFGTEKDRLKLAKLVSDLGSIVEEGVLKHATHLVVQRDKGHANRLIAKSRTLKYIQAMSRGLWIVDPSWIKESSRRNRWIKEDRFEMEGDSKSLSLGQHGPATARQNRDSPDKLFSKALLYLCGSFKPPHLSKRDVRDLFERLGGTISKSSRQLDNSSAKFPTVVLLAQSAESAKGDPSFAQLKSLNLPFVNSQWLLNSISTYAVQPPDAYAFDMD